MKIAILNLYSGINDRGAEAFTHELGNRLLNHHEIVFFQSGNRTHEQKMQVVRIKSALGQPASSFSDQMVPAIAKRFFLDAGNRSVLDFSRKLLQQVVRGGFDVVVPMNGFWQILLVKLSQRLGKYKILVTGHAGPGWDERWNLYLHPDVFIATTKPAAEWAIKTSPRTRIELVPYGISTEEFARAVPTSIKLAEPVVLCPSALVPYKRIDLAIKAVASMKDVSLLVLGQGELEGYLRKLGKRLLHGRFRLMSVPHDQMPAYYQGADLVTLPSSPQENSPMVFLESLAARKIVVTTDTPRNRWMLKGAGIFCDPLNIKQYGEALRRALMLEDDPKMRSKIDTAVQKFEVRKVVERYEELMEGLIQ